MKRTVILFSILTIAALMLGACSLLGGSAPAQAEQDIPIVQDEGAVISEGNLVPEKYMYLTFPTGGHVAEILVQPGDAVTEGQVLARLGDRQQAEANIAAAQLELENAQQALDSLNENADIAALNAELALLDANEQVITAQLAWNEIDTEAYQDRIDAADIRLTDAQTALEDAQDEFDNYTSLDANNPTRRNAETALNNAQNAYDQAVAERDRLVINRQRAQASLALAQELQAQAQLDYDATRTGPDPDVLALAQLRLENAQAQLDAAQSALELRDLVAPFDGSVVDVNAEVNELVGSEQWAVLVADFSSWYVETNDLTELEVVSIAVGQGAVIAPDAFPEQTFTGEVTEIADVFRLQGGDVLYVVRLSIAEPDPAFRWGMTVEVRFNP